MGVSADANPLCCRRARRARLLEPLAWAVATLAVATSAIVVKERGAAPPLARVDDIRSVAAASSAQSRPLPESQSASDSGVQIVVTPATPAQARNIRWFDGRPVRPARTVSMVVTGYSPDARSCGQFADGQTATLHSVYTNAMQLVAADPRVLPYGSIVSVPGYASGELVPVLDCGQAIKGNRLDLLYPTHAQARQWGRKRVSVTIWEFADGLPPTNPRKAR